MQAPRNVNGFVSCCIDLGNQQNWVQIRMTPNMTLRDLAFELIRQNCGIMAIEIQIDIRGRMLTDGKARVNGLFLIPTGIRNFIRVSRIGG